MGELMFQTRKITLTLAAVISAGFTTTAIAAEDVPTVVVSAARSQQSTVTIPTNIHVVTREEIAATGATSVTEVLNTIGGVHIQDLFGDNSQTKIQMRGFGDTAVSNVLVIVDGRRLNNIDLSGPDLSSISLKDIEQIEVIQGSAGVLYGDQAVAGVINIVTRKPEAFNASAQVQAGSYDRVRFQASVSDKLDNNLSYLVTTEAIRSDNYRENNELDKTNVLGRLDYDLSSGRVFTEVQRVRRVNGLPGSLSEAEVNADPRQASPFSLSDYADAETDVVRLGMDTMISENWSVEAEVAKREAQSTSDYSGFIYSIESEQKEFTPRVIGSLDMNGRQAIVTTGIDYLEADYDNGFRNDYESSAAYLQAVLPLSDRAQMTVGGRKARFENKNAFSKFDDSVTAAELGVQGKISDNTTLFVRVDDNFRFGKIDELSFTDVTKDLETQEGRSHEIGAEWQNNAMVVKAQVYRLELENEIAYDPNANGPVPGFGANVNLDPTRHDGFVVDARYSLSNSWNLQAAFSYDDASFREGVNAGNKLSGVPERQLSVSTRYHASNGMAGYLEGLYVGEHYAAGDDANLGPKLDSYTIVNANVSYQWDDLELGLRVNNLFDKEYSSYAVSAYGSTYYYPSPERNFWITAAVKF